MVKIVLFIRIRLCELHHVFIIFLSFRSVNSGRHHISCERLLASEFLNQQVHVYATCHIRT